MRNAVEIENIEHMRLCEGIDDVALRQEIRELRTGSRVKLTLLTEAGSRETVVVRITSIRGSSFRGKLTSRPFSAAFSRLLEGSSLVFTTDHIHSIPGRQPDHDR